IMFIAFFLGVLLLPKADTLKCYESRLSEDGDGTEEKIECPSQQCFAMRSTVIKGKGMSEMKQKGCAGPKQLCHESSQTIGDLRVVFRGKCCSKDLCNSQFPPEYKPIPNGRKCISCYGKNCTGPINCEGDENYYITNMSFTSFLFSERSFPVKGCTSKFVCSNKLHPETIQISCCKGDYCNSARSSIPSILWLMPPAVSRILG
uniref:UPAR/Ly6 domain-containing protein n=1 Tax=Cyprinodon variegatus TaxID=28743 RepID=A0A3Q2D4G6_CYPVA